MQILHVDFNKYPTKVSLLLQNYIANEVMQFNELPLMKYMSHYIHRVVITTTIWENVEVALSSSHF